MQPFQLYLIALDSSHFQADVTASPVGESGVGPVTLELPFLDGPTDRRLTVLKVLELRSFRPEHFQAEGEQAWLVANGLLNAAHTAFKPDRLAKIGQILYQILFPSVSRLGERLRQSLAVVQNEARPSRLLVEIKIGAEAAQTGRLFDYPWELLHDGRDFLALRQVSFSRYIAYEAGAPRLSGVERLGVLLISSAASDPANGLTALPDTEGERVRAGLEKADREGRVSLSQLEGGATFENLQKYLVEQPAAQLPQILHFDGHGFFGKRCRNFLEDEGRVCNTMHYQAATVCKHCGADLPAAQGFLLFESAAGGPHYVSANELGTVLMNNSLRENGPASLMLVVLSACKSAQVLADTSIFNGVAQNLIAARLPSVVAMQFSVGVTEAGAFAEGFYRWLGQRSSLSEAVSQGRLAMGSEGDQWYRPVLYLRWQDNGGGQLFAPTTTTEPTKLPVSISDSSQKSTQSKPDQRPKMTREINNFELTSKLLACPRYANPVSRQTIIAELPPVIRQALPNPLALDDKMYTVGVIRACSHYPDGLKTLIGKVLEAEDDTDAAQELRKLAQEFGIL